MPTLASHQAVLQIAFNAARSVADRHRAELMADPNVIDVQAGYRFTGGWITDLPAVVVTVLQKGDPQSLGSQPLPAELDGFPIDIAAATPAEQLRHLSRTGEETRAATATLPPIEDFLQPGSTPAVAEATRSAVGSGTRQYVKPPGLKLESVGAPISLLCHASPDAGWPTLRKFLADIRSTLTVAMYDFGARHVFDAIATAMADADGTFVLNLDRRSNPKRDGELTEEQVVSQFKRKLKGKFVSSTAAVGSLYPNAYHIKVAVRDGKAFWISSGNWQGSNQPAVDAFKLDESALRQLFSKHNREWHIVCRHPRLAATFEAYIQYDVAEAERVGTRGVTLPPLPDLSLPIEPELETRAAARPVKRFRPRNFVFKTGDRIKVHLLRSASFTDSPVLSLSLYDEVLRDPPSTILLPSTWI